MASFSNSTMVFSCLLIVAFLTSPRPAIAASAVCPFTGQAPTTTTVAYTRCLDANKQTCCGPCVDEAVALDFATSTVLDFVDLLAPSVKSVVATLLGSSTNLATCDATSGSPYCFALLEAMICAVGCNPDAGNYVVANSTGYTINVCPSFANAFYNECTAVNISVGTSLPGAVSLSALFPDAASFVSAFVSGLGTLLASSGIVPAGTSVPTFTHSITSAAGCFGGPTTLPKKEICCDPLTPSATCNATTNSTQLNIVKSRQGLTSAACVAENLSAASDGVAAPASAPGSAKSPSSPSSSALTPASAPSPSASGALVAQVVPTVAVVAASVIAMAASWL